MKTRIVEMLTRLAIDNPGIRNNQFKFGAGIVYKNHLIATGVNSYKTHPLMAEWGQNELSICLHAEIDAIKNALKLITLDQLSKCDLYIVRVKRPDANSTGWVHGLAKPCKGCTRAIANFDLKKVYYTTDDHWDCSSVVRASVL